MKIDSQIVIFDNPFARRVPALAVLAALSPTRRDVHCSRSPWELLAISPLRSYAPCTDLTVGSASLQTGIRYVCRHAAMTDMVPDSRDRLVGSAGSLDNLRNCPLHTKGCLRGWMN